MSQPFRAETVFARWKPKGGWRNPGFLLGIIGLATLFVALRWNSLRTPLVRDEGEYAYAAQLMTHGIAPYRAAFVQKPPMVVYAYAVASAVVPGVFWGPRLLACISIALTTLLIGLIARAEFGTGCGLVAAWLFTPMVLLPGIQQFTANTEMFMLLPLTALVAAHAAGSRLVDRRRLWVLEGILGTTSLLFKYTALPVVAWIAGAALLEEWITQRRGRAVRKCMACWLAGVAIGLVGGLGAFAVTGNLKNLWECTVSFNRFYANSSMFGVGPMWFVVKLLLTDWWILFLLPGVLIFQATSRTWFWLGLWIAAWVATGGSIYGHYYIIVMPVWALICAAAINDAARFVAKILSWPERGLRLAFAGVTTALLCWSHLEIMTQSPREFALERLGDQQVFLKSQAIAEHLARATRPGDPVFIAGSEPQILYYAHRRSASRFVIMYPLTVPTPLAEQFQDEAIRELERVPPAVIVRVRSEMSWMLQPDSRRKFSDYLDTLFEQKYQCLGGYLLDEETNEWKGPFIDGIVEHPTIALYERKRS